MAMTKEQRAEYQKKWIANNREKWNAYQRKRYLKTIYKNTSEPQINIGEAIKKARLDKGYSKYRLAKEANVTFQTLGKWEKGENYPNIYNLIPIADALNISLDELVGRTVASDERN